MAYVHPEAKMGDNNIIGPFCYIDRNTVIGDNNAGGGAVFTITLPLDNPDDDVEEAVIMDDDEES